MKSSSTVETNPRLWAVLKAEDDEEGVEELTRGKPKRTRLESLGVDCPYYILHPNPNLCY
jgi:hypothetical protein